jgi:pimeloyl-ACP methyl ester carboxylesterase
MNVETSTLFYTKSGNGKEVLLLFHGFGQDNAVFTPLAKSLADRYTCYIFDLYFHGKSKWVNDEKPLEKSEWRNIMQSFLNETHIKTFSLLGYSLGGKFALATVEAFPQMTKELFLLAPDGVTTNFWYSLATYPWVSRKLFKSMINHHGRFLAIGKSLHRVGLIDKGVLRFAEYQMDTAEKRKRVYYSWVVFRKLKFNMRDIGGLINHHKISLTIIVGKYDKVITPKSMNRLSQSVEHHRLHVIEAGHNLLSTRELGNLL